VFILHPIAIKNWVIITNSRSSTSDSHLATAELVEQGALARSGAPCGRRLALARVWTIIRRSTPACVAQQLALRKTAAAPAAHLRPLTVVGRDKVVVAVIAVVVVAALALVLAFGPLAFGPPFPALFRGTVLALSPRASLCVPLAARLQCLVHIIGCMHLVGAWRGHGSCPLAQRLLCLLLVLPGCATLSQG
jgi:hypothetical protein